MAYDLAIGVVENISESHQTLLNNWRVLADWRHPENTDPETFQYVHKGILPKEIKIAMNYPNKHMPKNNNMVVNDFYHSIPFIDKKILKQGTEEELKKPKYQKLTEPPQWVFPDPDLKGVTDVD